MFKVVLNLPRIEDGYYLDKRLTAAPYKTSDEALRIFEDNAAIFIGNLYKSDKMITKDHWNDGTIEFYYVYTNPYDVEQEYYLGGVEVIDEEAYYIYED